MLGAWAAEYGDSLDELDAIHDYLGSTRHDDFVTYWLGDGQRVGQAFFNALPRSDREVLLTSRHDPFHSDDLLDVIDAIGFLEGVA